MLLPFSAEKLVRQNSFPQIELGALIGGLLSSAMIYLVLKETNQNLKKLSEEILFRYFLLYVSSENLTRLFYFSSFQSKSTASLARQCYRLQPPFQCFSHVSGTICVSLGKSHIQ